MIFLLGGNGFVGSAYRRWFEEQGISHVILTRDNYSDYVGAECDLFINANGNSKKFLGTKDPAADFAASVTSVRQSLIDFRCKKYVFLSTSDVYPDCSSPASTLEDCSLSVAQQSPYGFHKHLAELCVQHASRDWLIVRQGGFVGPGLRKNAVFDVLYGERLWVHPDSRFQYISVDDSARAVCDLVDRDISNQIVNLTSMGTIAVRDIMHMAGRSVQSDDALNPVRYEISVAKAQQWLQLPDTFSTVQRFLETV